MVRSYLSATSLCCASHAPSARCFAKSCVSRATGGLTLSYQYTFCLRPVNAVANGIWNSHSEMEDIGPLLTP
jgi:hypothetical protein